MLVSVAEVGDRPAVLTAARRNAPQGAVAIGQTLERFTFADNGFVILDWSDAMGRQEVPNPIPVIYVLASKRIPKYEVNPWVDVEVRLDVEDVFGTDDITAANIVEVVANMEAKMMETIARRESVAQ